MDEKTRTLLKGYPDKAEEKIQAAEFLSKNKKYDDAVSRVYYSSFHAAHAVLLTEGLSANTHQGLVNLFGLHFAKTGKLDKKFGKFLANLKDDRETSDYEIYSSIDEQTARHAFSEAQEFLQEMKRYLTPYLA